MKKITFLVMVLALMALVVQAQTTGNDKRAMWGSINGRKDASTGDYQSFNNKVLISWRMLPGDNENTAFDLYRSVGTNTNETKIAADVKGITNVYDTSASTSQDNHYRLTYAGSSTTIATYTMKAAQVKDKLPYVSIPLRGTTDVCDLSYIRYQANDCSVGDLDGDGEMEIVVKRLLTVLDSDGKVVSDGADLDGDGKCEFVTKTGEGTIFGNGMEIGDTDNDGVTDYRNRWPSGHYTGDGPNGYGGPEFFSVCDGATGEELARANFIARAPEGQTPAQWAANWYENDWTWDPRDKKYYWKLANSLRLGAASFDGKTMQVFLGRGVYGRTIVEAWRYANGSLTRMWHFDSSTSGGNNKDGKPNSAYAGQGNHSFNVADLDGDGRDEVMYGSCAFDDDGTGLWSSGLGHGDASHVGKFLPDRDGLQVFHCLETGKTMVALHDAKDGSVIWKKDSDSDNDTGRCLVGDFLPQYPGCEFYYYQGNIIQSDGTETVISTNGIKGGCAMAVWFDGTLSRQQMEDNIVNSMTKGRTFTMYRYDMSSTNGTKGNPGWYGDFLGDWREEIIMPSADKLTDIKIFSTWYLSEHKFPWLMTDHTYYMSCINQNVGYNQPTNLGYYLGSDLESDAEAWEAGGYLNGQTWGSKVAEGTYYLYHVGTGKFLTSGNHHLH